MAKDDGEDHIKKSKLLYNLRGDKWLQDLLKL